LADEDLFTEECAVVRPATSCVLDVLAARLLTYLGCPPAVATVAMAVRLARLSALEDRTEFMLELLLPPLDEPDDADPPAAAADMDVKLPPPEDTGKSSALGPLRGETVALLLCVFPLSLSRSFFSLLFWSVVDVEEDALWDFSCPAFEVLAPDADVEDADAEGPARGNGGEIVPERE